MSIKEWTPQEATDAAAGASYSRDLHISDAGPLIFASWRPQGPKATLADVRLAYLEIDAALRRQRAVPLQERVFGERTMASCVARARTAALGDEDERWSMPPTFIEGAPLGRPGTTGLHIVAVRRADVAGHRTISEDGTVFGRLVTSDDATWIGLGDLARRGARRRTMGPAEEVGVALNAAADLLSREGFAFTDVLRTWYYLRDILEWYGPFNAVRNEAFHHFGVLGPEGKALLPASTGIGGVSTRGGWCTLDLLAMRPRLGAHVEIKRLYNRRQNEATEYGSAFARGTALTLGGFRYVFVSGTASIDEHGTTVHAGNFEAQVRRTLDNVNALLHSAGAAPAHVCQGTAFLKRASDRAAYARILGATPFADRPILETIADVCRDDLLYELDAVAVVPIQRRRLG